MTHNEDSSRSNPSTVCEHEREDLLKRKQFIRSHLHLVNYVLARLVNTSLMGKGVLDFDDLYSSGVIGLIEAVDKFDPSRDVKFSTFAVPRIRGAILDAVRAADPVPRSIRQRGKKLRRAYTDLEQQLRRTVTEEELAESVDMSVEEIQRVFQVLSAVPPVSLDEVLSREDDSQVSRMDSIDDPQASSPRAWSVKAEIEDKLCEAISTLEDRERALLAMYYSDGLTFREIGLVMEVTESRICQMHTRILFRLRARLRGYDFEELSLRQFEE